MVLVLKCSATFGTSVVAAHSPAKFASHILPVTVSLDGIVGTKFIKSGVAPRGPEPSYVLPHGRV